MTRTPPGLTGWFVGCGLLLDWLLRLDFGPAGWDQQRLSLLVRLDNHAGFVGMLKTLHRSVPFVVRLNVT